MAHEKCYAICESKCQVETLSKEQIELPIGTVLMVNWTAYETEDTFNKKMGYGVWKHTGTTDLSLFEGGYLTVLLFRRIS